MMKHWFTAMSQIEKLEMVGFKSFCDRTQLSFHQGITAVVGPNGCGKSNIADAISWVVGEQSAKSLRTDRMEGIIFNGTQARKATSMAEVILSLKLLDNLRVPEGIGFESGGLHSRTETLSVRGKRVLPRRRAGAA